MTKEYVKFKNHTNAKRFRLGVVLESAAAQLFFPNKTYVYDPTTEMHMLLDPSTLIPTDTNKDPELFI